MRLESASKTALGFSVILQHENEVLCRLFIHLYCLSICVLVLIIDYDFMSLTFDVIVSSVVVEDSWSGA